MIQKIGINQLKFSKGKKIYAKGDAAHFAYYVHSGKVNIYSPGGLLLGKIGEGEIFGERGPSLDESRSVTAEADTNCILYPINEKTLKLKLEEADPVVRAIVRSYDVFIWERRGLKCIFSLSMKCVFFSLN